MTEEFTPLAKRNQSLGLKAKAFFFLQKKMYIFAIVVTNKTHKLLLSILTCSFCTYLSMLK